MPRTIDIEIHPLTERDVGVSFSPLLAPEVTLTGTPTVDAGPLGVSSIRINSETFYDADGVHTIPEEEGVVFTLSAGDAILGRTYEVVVEADLSDGGHEAVTIYVVVRR